MNTEQYAKFASYRAVEALLKATTETSGIAGLPASLTALSARIDELHRLGKTQTQPTDPKTSRRNELLQDMIEAALIVAGAAKAHAHEQKLTELSRILDVSEGDFARARKEHRSWIAQRIHDAVAAVLPQLGPHGVTAEMLADLQAKIDAVHAGLSEPRTTIAEKRAATARLRERFAEIDGLLERQIDGKILALRKTSPEFYVNYVAARDVARRRKSSTETNSVAPAAVAAPSPAPATEPSAPISKAA